MGQGQEEEEEGTESTENSIVRDLVIKVIVWHVVVIMILLPCCKIEPGISTLFFY